MRNRKFAALFAVGALLLLASGAPGAQLRAGTPSDAWSGQLLITGSSTMAPLISAMAQRFRALHPQVGITVQAGGSGRGLLDARSGKADIGMVSRALSDSERDLYGLPIARDGVAVVVHKDNPVRMLADRQLSDIYAGKVVNWKQVGGRDAPILTVKAEAARSSSELFVHYLHMRFDDLQTQRIVGDNQARVKLMVEHPNAILYMSVGEAERSALAGAPIKSLAVGGVAATSKNIRNGDFPISRPLTLVTRGAPAGLVKDFIEYASSSQVTDLIVSHDFVPYLD
jgi:phosphate transport system substrate-binding protein